MTCPIRRLVRTIPTRLVALVFAFFCVAVYGPTCSAAALNISSPSAVLMEAHTGQILFEKDIDTPRPPASMTKIMTMLLVMEALDRGQISLDDIVATSEHAARMGGTQIWLAVGEEMSVEDLLKSVAIASANDAAVALAEHVAGAAEAFVDLMNKRAAELGATNTTFVNPTGLPSDGGPQNLASARDIALISMELLKHPKILQYTSTWIDQVRGGNPVLNNTNRLVRYYDGCDGIKTGYIEDSKHCLAATAMRDNLRLISVVMGADSSNERYDDTRKLLDYGFANYQAVPVAKAGQIIGEAEVSKGEYETVSVAPSSDVTVVLPKSESRDVETKMVFDERVVAPVAKGQVVGRFVVTKGERVLASMDLVAAQDVLRGSPIKLFFRSLRNLFGLLFR